MSFEQSSVPTLEELCERSIEEIAGHLGVKKPLPEKSVTRVLGSVFGGLTYGLYLHLDSISAMTMPDTAEGEWLDRWADIVGIKRKPATFSEVLFQFESSLFPDGDLVAGQYRYTVIAPGKAIAQIRGPLTALPTGASIGLLQPIVGVPSEGKVTGCEAGLPEESDDELRRRVLLQIAEPPAAGSPSDWQRWTLEVPGITRCVVHRGPRPIVVCVADSQPNKVPTAAMMQATREHLFEKSITQPNVIPAKPKTVAFVLRGPASEAKQAMLTEHVKRLVNDVPPNGTFFLSDIPSPIIAPTENIVCAFDEVLVFGGVSWQM